MADFQTGVTYNRRADIHARFHGQMQGGISTPAKHSVIFAFTGTSGRRHGYSDELTQDGVFRYFGEGQEGDMTFTGGNRAIRDHANNGKELLLFDTIRSGQVRFRGEYNCAGYSIEPALDRLGKKRHAIVFHLLPVGTEIVEGADQDTPSQPVLAIELLRAQAYAAARPAQKGTPTESKHAHFIRSAQVRQYILARAGGACESCQRPAPFVTSVGKPYLEPHHIRRLSDGGPDDPRFVGALCPNCHREVHHGRMPCNRMTGYKSAFSPRRRSTSPPRQRDQDSLTCASPVKSTNIRPRPQADRPGSTLAALIPEARFEAMEDAGHFPHLQAPGDTGQVGAAFSIVVLGFSGEERSRTR